VAPENEKENNQHTSANDISRGIWMPGPKATFATRELKTTINHLLPDAMDWQGLHLAERKINKYQLTRWRNKKQKQQITIPA